MQQLHFVSTFRSIPEQEKPREKLLKYGPKSLNLWELIAIVLRTGKRTKEYTEDVMHLSRRILGEAGFKGLFTQTSIAALQHNFGVYKIHAEALVAVAEICRRLQGQYDIFDASEPSKVFEKFQFLQKAKQEQCFVLHLDAQTKCVYQEMVAIGSNTQVRVSPNDILRTPLWIGTKEIMVVHNHPQAAIASREDISWTLAIAKGALELHDIHLVDHVIVGSDGYFSFFEQGLL